MALPSSRMSRHLPSPSFPLVSLASVTGRSSSIPSISPAAMPGRAPLLPVIGSWSNSPFIPIWRRGSLGPPILSPPIMIPIPVPLPVPSTPVFLELPIGNMPVPRGYMPVVRGQTDHGVRNAVGLHENPGPIIRTGPKPVVLVGPIPVPAEKQNFDIDGRREIHIGPGDRNHGRRDRDHQWRGKGDADADVDVHFGGGWSNGPGYG